MTLVLDAGALVAVERRDREVEAVVKREWDAGRLPVTHGGVVGQVWRGGWGRQKNLARILRGISIHALDETLGRRAGVLLGLSGAEDVIDATVVLLAADGDAILTSDPEDLAELVAAHGHAVEVVRV